MPLLKAGSQLLGGASVRYLLRDEFTTARAAGAITTTVAEPGPGTRTVADTESKLTIAENDLVFGGGMAVPAFGDPGLSFAAQARTAGRMMVAGIRHTGGTIAFGFEQATSGTPVIATAYLAVANVGLRATATVTTETLTLGELYDIAVILRAAGAFFLIRGGADFPSWTLVHATIRHATASLYPIISSNTGATRVRYLRVPDALWLPAPSASDSFNRANAATLGTTDGAGHAEANGGSGLAWTANVGAWAIATNKAAATDVAGAAAIATVDAGAANVLMNAMITFAGGAGIGVVARYVDASNYVRAYHDGTNIKLDKVVGGSVTNLFTVANTTNNAQLQLRAKGTTFQVMYNNASVGTVQTVSDAALQSSTRAGIVALGTASTIDAVDCWQLTAANYSGLDKFAAIGTRRLFHVGDSKTDGDIWPTYLWQSLNTSAGDSTYYELVTRFGVTGSTAAEMHTYVDANLAAVTGTADIITINLGANDVSALPAEATWKADMTAIVDALRAKWSAATIYIARPWRRDYGTECNTLATWIAAIVATYPSNVYVGMDERVWLEGGDDGATMTTDGIHYSAAGQTAAAAAWAAVIPV
jgi:lysophospholipase L1-like esterase